MPEDAIVAGGDGPAVFVARDCRRMQRAYPREARADRDGRARRRGVWKCESGLRDGDRVVVTGADALAEDALVIETETKS